MRPLKKNLALWQNRTVNIADLQILSLLAGV